MSKQSESAGGPQLTSATATVTAGPAMAREVRALLEAADQEDDTTVTITSDLVREDGSTIISFEAVGPQSKIDSLRQIVNHVIDGLKHAPADPDPHQA